MKTVKPVCRLLMCMLILIPLLGATPTLRSSGQIPAISKSINAFTVDLLQHNARSSKAPVNSVISAQSIFHGLAMSYIASGGKTRQELAAVLRFPENNRQLIRELATLRAQFEAAAKHQQVDACLANAVWVQAKRIRFRKEYLRDLKNGFDADLNPMVIGNEEGISKEINSWISEKTRGKITKSISPDDLILKKVNQPKVPELLSFLTLVTVNTAYFEADWGSQFDKGATCKRPFHLDSSSQVQTMMMHQCSELSYTHNQKFKFLEMPYVGRTFSMCILLPKKLWSVKEIMAELSTEMIADLQRKAFARRVDVLLPKFNMRGHLRAQKVLKQMGVKLAFDRMSADFHKMIVKSKKRPLETIFIDKIYHDAWIDVHEQGTQAAASTTTTHFSLGCCATAMPQPVKFHANQPFLFMIMHRESGSIVFAGWMANPEEGNETVLAGNSGETKS